MGVWNLVSKSDVSKPVIGKKKLFTKITSNLFSYLKKFPLAICSFIHDNVNTLKFKIGERLEVVEECQGKLKSSHFFYLNY